VTQNNEYKGWFDGAYLWDEGHAAYGCLLKCDERIVFSDSGYIGASRTTLSVNCAEYAGLISLLNHMISANIEDARIFGDSKLVVNQMARRWKVKAGIYLPYYVQAAPLRDKLPRVTYKWLPRTLNTEADDLSKIPLRPFYYGHSVDPIDAAFEYAIQSDKESKGGN
jgi:ribonuclease HI